MNPKWMQKLKGIPLSKMLLKRRILLSGTMFEYLLVLAFFVGLTFIYTNFIVFNISTELFIDGAGDGTAGFMWLNYVDRGLSPFLVSTDFVNYPFGEALGSASFITYSALWLPLRFFSFIFDPVTGLNIVTFSGYISAAMSTYWLVKRLTNSIWVSLFAGFAVTFTPYALYKSSGHLAYIFSVVFVLVTAGFIGLWRRPTWQRAILLSLALALAFYTDGYFLLLASVLSFCALTGGFLYAIIVKFHLPDYLVRLKYFGLSLSALLILLVPLAYVQLTRGDEIKDGLAGVRTNIVNEMNEYRAWPIDFLLPPKSNPFLQSNSAFLELNDHRNERSNPSENTNYIGYVFIALCFVGLLLFATCLVNEKYRKSVQLRSPHFILVASIALISIPVMIAFMLSPSVNILGHVVPMPGQLLLDLNIGYWRVLSRFYIPLHVIVVLFSCVVLALVIKRIELVKSISFKNVKLAGVVVVIPLCLMTAAEYATTIGRPSFDMKKMPSGYSWMAQQENIKVVAELPFVDPLDLRMARYATAQIIHGKKLVNIKESSDARMNNVTGTIDNPESINYILQRGVDTVVLHSKVCDSVYSWGRLIHETESFDPTDRLCIYRVSSDQQSDGAFVVYRNGILKAPQYMDASRTVVSDSMINFEIKDRSLKTPYNGDTEIRMNLICSGPQYQVGEWSIVRSGTKVAEGVINDGRATISSVLRQANSASLVLKFTQDREPSNSCDIQDVVVSKITL